MEMAPRATSAKIAGLTAGQSYRFTVAAKNRRLFAVPDMIKAYRALLAHHRGQVERVLQVGGVGRAELDPLPRAGVLELRCRPPSFAPPVASYTGVLDIFGARS